MVSCILVRFLEPLHFFDVEFWRNTNSIILILEVILYKKIDWKTAGLFQTVERRDFNSDSTALLENHFGYHQI